MVPVARRFGEATHKDEKHFLVVLTDGSIIVTIESGDDRPFTVPDLYDFRQVCMGALKESYLPLVPLTIGDPTPAGDPWPAPVREHAYRWF